VRRSKAIATIGRQQLPIAVQDCPNEAPLEGDCDTGSSSCVRMAKFAECERARRSKAIATQASYRWCLRSTARARMEYAGLRTTNLMSRGGAKTRRRQFEGFFSASSASPRETRGSAEKADPLKQYWACYDIADDRRRQRLSDVLLDFRDACTGKRLSMPDRPVAGQGDACANPANDRGEYG
jgi:hypothetical protein